MYKTKEGIWVRDRGEEGVREQQREYRGLIDIFPGGNCGDVWDVGAHVGWFPWFLRKHLRPGRVLCVECSPRQLEVLRRNRRPGDVILAGALVADDYAGAAVDLYLGRTYSSCDSTYCPVRGRDRVSVPVVRFSDLTDRVPSPSVVKLDCEGAEYGMVPARHLPASVRALVAEFHYNRKGQRGKLLNLDMQLRRLGFERTSGPLKFSDYTKTMHVTYRRTAQPPAEIEP